MIKFGEIVSLDNFYIRCIKKIIYINYNLTYDQI